MKPSARTRARPRPLGAPALAADSFSTDWARASKAEARLVAAGAGRQRSRSASRLARSPIGATPATPALPPTFRFLGLAQSGAAPSRLFPRRSASPSPTAARRSATTTACLSVRVAARDPAKPVSSSSSSTIAVCEKALPAGEGATFADPARRPRFALRERDRRGGRRRAARGPAGRNRRARGDRRRHLAPLRGRARKARRAISSSRRPKAGGSRSRPRPAPKGARLLRARAAAQAGRRGAPQSTPADAHRRCRRGRDENRDS